MSDVKYLDKNKQLLQRIMDLEGIDNLYICWTDVDGKRWTGYNGVPEDMMVHGELMKDLAISILTEEE